MTKVSGRVPGVRSTLELRGLGIRRGGGAIDVDLLVTGGSVLDGSGESAVRADVGVRGDRIVAIARPGDGELRGSSVLPAHGRLVTPGFVDTNTHADWALIAADHSRLLVPALLQGVTTLVGGGCGFSPAPAGLATLADLSLLCGFLRDPHVPLRPRSFPELVAEVDALPLPGNVALMVGQQALRCAVGGLRPRALTPDERSTLRDLLGEALDAGAVAVSGNLGFVPGCWADVAEVRLLADAAAAAGIPLAVHARAYTAVSPTYPPVPRPAHDVRAVRELAEVALASGARVQISHLAVAGRRTWRYAEEVLAEIDTARRDGADLAFDVVPYPTGVGPMQMLFPPSAVLELMHGRVRRSTRARLTLLAALQRRLLGLSPRDVRLLRALDQDADRLLGLDFEQIGRVLRTGRDEAQLQLAVATRLQAVVALAAFSGDDSGQTPLELFLRHPAAVVVSNAAYRADGVPDPAAAGAFVRLLGRHVRGGARLPLEQAVRMATEQPAERYGLRDVGRVEVGRRADLIVLDPDRVDEPLEAGRAPPGIDAVVVGGQVAVSHGAVIPGTSTGRLLRAG